MMNKQEYLKQKQEEAKKEWLEVAKQREELKKKFNSFFQEFEVSEISDTKKLNKNHNYELLWNGEPTGVYSVDKDILEKCLPEIAGLVAEQAEDEESNYGLAFYACGYDGERQQKFLDFYEDLGIELF